MVTTDKVILVLVAVTCAVVLVDYFRSWKTIYLGKDMNRKGFKIFVSKPANVAHSKSQVVLSDKIRWKLIADGTTIFYVCYASGTNLRTLYAYPGISSICSGGENQPSYQLRKGSRLTIEIENGIYICNVN